MLKLPVSATRVMDELLFIEVYDLTLTHFTLEYRILTPDKKVIRKGYFKGQSVQLRINHLSDGFYHLELLAHSEHIQTHTFQKRTNLPLQFELHATKSFQSLTAV